MGVSKNLSLWRGHYKPISSPRNTFYPPWPKIGQLIRSNGFEETICYLVSDQGVWYGDLPNWEPTIGTINTLISIFPTSQRISYQHPLNTVFLSPVPPNGGHSGSLRRPPDTLKLILLVSTNRIISIKVSHKFFEFMPIFLQKPIEK